MKTDIIKYYFRKKVNEILETRILEKKRDCFLIIYLFNKEDKEEFHKDKYKNISQRDRLMINNQTNSFIRELILSI